MVLIEVEKLKPSRSHRIKRRIHVKWKKFFSIEKSLKCLCHVKTFQDFRSENLCSAGGSIVPYRVKVSLIWDLPRHVRTERSHDCLEETVIPVTNLAIWAFIFPVLPATRGAGGHQYGSLSLRAHSGSRFTSKAPTPFDAGLMQPKLSWKDKGMLACFVVCF